MPIRVRQLAMWAATLVVLGTATFTVVDAVRGWNLSDMDAYWGAAMRIRLGEALYVESYSVGAHDLYRYTPWFAYAWVPLTYLPHAVVAIGWLGALLAATGASIWPAIRRRSLAGVLVSMLLGSFLFWTASKANVQPLLVATLVFGVRGRAGPLWIAAAASLKAAPLAFVAVYLGRGEWARAAWTLGLTALLTAPMLLFDLSAYPANPGLSLALYYAVSPGAWLAGAMVGVVAALSLARTRWAWLAGGAAAIAGLPRLLSYDFSFLLVATATDRDDVPG